MFSKKKNANSSDINTRTRVRLSIHEKLKVLYQLDSNNTEREVAKTFGISRSAVQLIKKSRESLVETHKNSSNLKRKNLSRTQKFSVIN
jgi:predicted DNA-binding protein YlxM (UPF0122 family)